MGSLLLDYPAGSQGGDVLVAYVQAFEYYTSGAVSPWSASFPGWTKVHEDLITIPGYFGVYMPTAAAIFTKVAEPPRDPRGSSALFEHPSVAGVAGTMLAYVGTSSPIVIGIPVSAKGAGREAMLPSQTAEKDDLVVGFVAVNQASVASQTGMTPRESHVVPLGSETLLVQASDIFMPSPGPTGPRMWPITPLVSRVPPLWATGGVIIRCDDDPLTCLEQCVQELRGCELGCRYQYETCREDPSKAPFECVLQLMDCLQRCDDTFEACLLRCVVP